MFDRLNARSPFTGGLKKAITRDNLLEFQFFFAEAEEYFRGLTNLDGRPMMNTRLRTFLVGFITGMKSIIGLATDIFEENDGTVWYLIPYRLCQDSLEHFFGDIRCRGGWCQNPTPLGFKFAYRALLSNRLRISHLSVGRNCLEIVDTTDDGLLPNFEHDVDLDAESDRCDLLLSELQHDWPSELRSNILFYMAGWAARKVAKGIKHSFTF